MNKCSFIIMSTILPKVCNQKKITYSLSAEKKLNT